MSTRHTLILESIPQDSSKCADCGNQRIAVGVRDEIGGVNSVATLEVDVDVEVNGETG